MNFETKRLFIGFFPKHFNLDGREYLLCQSAAHSVFFGKFVQNLPNVAFFGALRASVVMTRNMKIIEFLKPL